MCRIVHCGGGGSDWGAAVVAAILGTAVVYAAVQMLAVAVEALAWLMHLVMVLGIVLIVAAAGVWLLRELLTDRQDARQEAAMRASLVARGIRPIPRTPGVAIRATSPRQIETKRPELAVDELVDLDALSRRELSR
jgi:hypothetical protein